LKKAKDFPNAFSQTGPSSPNCSRFRRPKRRAKATYRTMKGGTAALALLLALTTKHATAVTFQFVAEFNENCTSSTIDRIAAVHDTIIAPFFQSQQSEGYEFVEPGGSAPAAAATTNISETSTAETTEVVNGSGSVRGLQLIECPSKCKNSNSKNCQSLGCAKCWASCARRLWQSVSSSQYRYWSNSKASRITKMINPMLNKYLSSSSRTRSCKAWLSIYQINADGSTLLLN
jgi:hypothetical protein